MISRGGGGNSTRHTSGSQPSLWFQGYTRLGGEGSKRRGGRGKEQLRDWDQGIHGKNKPKEIKNGANTSGSMHQNKEKSRLGGGGSIQGATAGGGGGAMQGGELLSGSRSNV